MSVHLLTPEHLGKRVLVSIQHGVPEVIETKAEEFSPCGEFVRLNTDSPFHRHFPWSAVKEVKLLAVLGCALLMLAQCQPNLDAGSNDDAAGEHDVERGKLIQTAALGLRAGAGCLYGFSESCKPVAELEKDVRCVCPAVPFKEAFGGNLCAAIKLWGVKVKVFFHPEDSDSLASSLQLTTEGASREAAVQA